MDMVKVDGKEVMVVEYKGKRVLTTEQLADGFECDTYQIRQNYSNNADRFTEGVHFYKLEGEELKQFKASLGESKISTDLKYAPSIMLWTRRGASRHCKMLGTDKAWDMFDLLEDSYFNPAPPKQLSPLEILAQQANALVEQEKQLKALQAKQEAQAQELQGMRDVIQLSSAVWRKETTSLLNKIARNRGDDNFMEVRHESYQLLNERMGVSVEVRLANAKRRMDESGYSKTQINKLNALDVIGQDKKLIEGYMAVVKDMAIKYGVA
jgi:hypothetical protein